MLRLSGGGAHDLSPLGAEVTRLGSRRQSGKSPSVPAVTRPGDQAPDAAVADGPSDAELARRLCDADATALSGLYQRFGQSCYSLARRVCGDDGVAEDVVHEAFMTLWRDPSCGDPARGSIATSLLTLVHHKAVAAVRTTGAASQSRPDVPATDESATDEPAMDEPARVPVPAADQAPQDGVATGQVRAALDRLPGEQRAVLTAAYFGGHTLPEIAASSSVPIDTVKSRLVAGVRRLRSLLTEQPGPEAMITETHTGWQLSR